MSEIKRRPKKTEAEKLSETIFIRLNNADFETFSNIAFSRRLPVSLLMITLLAEKKCFAKTISDEEYQELLSRPEMMQSVSQNIPKKDKHVVACRMTKEDRKSLTYYAVVKKGCSPTVLVNSVMMECIKNTTKK